MSSNDHLSIQNQCVETGADVARAPRASVVIPAFNLAALIGETLESVFAQTFDSFEVLLVNDGSADTPELERALAPFRDRIVYVKQPNGGASAARNAGIKRARGEIIAFLDGDDLWLPEFLRSQIEFLDARDLDLVYADALLFGDVARDDETYMQNAVSDGAVTSESLLAWTCNVITSGTIVRKKMFDRCGLFDESPVWRRAQDFEMWFRLVRNGARADYQKKVLLKYRVRAGSLTGSQIEQARRNLVALHAINHKYKLTESEIAVWRKTMRLAQAIWEVEAGKAALKNGEYKAARQHFGKAAPLYSRPKIALLEFALRVAPRRVQNLIKDYNFER